MDKTESTRVNINRLRGEKLASDTLLMCVLRHLPHETLRSISASFDEHTEQVLVNAMNDSTPESFLQAFQVEKANWNDRLDTFLQE